DKENLVHALAMAVQAKRFDPTMVELLKPRLTTKDEWELWVVLRALQIVGFPELASDVVLLLPETPTASITYDILLVLTGPEMGDAGFIALRDRVGPERVVGSLLHASHGASDNKVRRFAHVLGWFKPDDLVSLSRAAESGGTFAATARRLMEAA